MENKRSTQRSFTQEVGYKNSHSREPLSGIYNACCCQTKENALLNECVEDPRYRHSGMTPNLMSGSHLTYKRESLNKAYRLGVSPTGAASEPWNNCHKVGNLSGYHPTYEEEALNKDSFKAPLRCGFTLIELLVVVLIIGILAAIAIPQYQKTYYKARAEKMLPLIKSIGLAEDLYYLEHGRYDYTLEDLAVKLPADFTGKTPYYNISMTGTHSNGEWSIQISTEGNYAGMIKLGQLTGPYAGSGFAYWPAYSYKNRYGKKTGESWLVCEEVLGKGVIFKKDPGDFCVKLFKGTALGTPTVAAYRMKW